MTRIVRKLLELTDSGGDRTQISRSTGNMTKFPHVAAGVMLEVGDGIVSKEVFKKAFSDTVKELQRLGYLKKGTLKSTAKGMKLSAALMETEKFYDLMDDYEELLKKLRNGNQETPYRGRVPLR